MFHTSLKNDKKLIKTIERKPNHIILTWETIYEQEYKYKLQMLNDIKEWKTIYWGKSDHYKVENLAPCTCYTFRISSSNISEDSEHTNWIHFKAATDEGPFYSIMHMTRYVRLGKTSMVRKIAHARPYLLDTENRENKTPTVQAIEAKDMQMISLLISLGANINKPIFYNKRTPLMIAIDKGQLQIAGFLIDKDANILAQDINGLNILHYAVDSNDLNSVKFCLNLLNNVNFKDNNGWTPLIRAAILGISQEIIDLLLKNGADKSLKDNNGINFETHWELSKFNLKNK